MAQNSLQSTKVVTGKIRFSYVSVFKPRSVNNSEAKYQASLIIPKSDKETLTKMREAVKAAIAAKWGSNVPKNLELPVRDGDIDKEDDEAYKGAFFINAKSKTAPGIVDANLQAIIAEEEFYSGCYGRASVNFYGYEASGKKGIACGLNNIQKLSDGPYLGGRTSAESDFSDGFVKTESAVTEDDGLGF